LGFRPLTDELRPAIARELGIPVGYQTPWETYLEGLQLRDVLDLVTVPFRLMRPGGTYDTSRWVNTVQRIFTEENVHYRVDDLGGVHFHFDEEFARNRAAAVAVLRSARFANALDAFESGMAELRKAPPDGKRAIRSVFSAVEGVFRLILPNAPRLGAAELDGLVPLEQKLYAEDETTRRSSAKMLSSLKDWVDAAHFYRHEEGAEEVAQPPLRLAVYIVSTGASHLRWLAELDTSLQPR
jgi:uncharacterized protein YqgV (UPF0045/DUF77 family)